MPVGKFALWGVGSPHTEELYFEDPLPVNTENPMTGSKIPLFFKFCRKDPFS